MNINYESVALPTTPQKLKVSEVAILQGFKGIQSHNVEYQTMPNYTTFAIIMVVIMAVKKSCITTTIVLYYKQ